MNLAGVDICRGGWLIASSDTTLQAVNLEVTASLSALFEAARQMNRLAIGVDSDQQAEAPGYVLTSMVKGVDAAVYDAIERVSNGTFTGGSFEFGLAEGGVDYVYDDNNRALIPAAARARVEALRDSIIRGAIPVPSSR